MIPAQSLARLEEGILIKGICSLLGGRGRRGNGGRGTEGRGTEGKGTGGRGTGGAVAAAATVEEASCDLFFERLYESNQVFYEIIESILVNMLL